MKNIKNHKEPSVNAKDSDERETKKRYTLGKENIIRGFGSFSEILKDAKVIETDYLKLFINKEEKPYTDSESGNLSESPLLTKNVKVGFIVAGKKVKKAVQRNRIKRLLRESYRLNKQEFCFSENLKIIFSLNEKGYLHFQKTPEEKMFFIDAEMKKASELIQIFINRK